MPVDTAIGAEWSRRHGDYDLSRSRLVRGWLTVVHAPAGPLARRGVSPDVVTAAGVAAAAAAAAVSRRRPHAAAVLVTAAAVLDGVDGAVAVRQGRDTGYGAPLDHTADRVSDVLFGVALFRAGCRLRVAAAGTASALSFELLRTARRRTGRRRTARPGIGTVTVADRPMRVALVVAGLLRSPRAAAVGLSVASVAGAVQLALFSERRHDRMVRPGRSDRR